MALVDGDPSGLSILSTYMDGSTAMRHESDKLAAGERIKWVGVHLSELSRCVDMSPTPHVQRLIGNQVGNRERFALTYHEL